MQTNKIRLSHTLGALERNVWFAGRTSNQSQLPSISAEQSVGLTEGWGKQKDSESSDRLPSKYFAVRILLQMTYKRGGRKEAV
jgi:hypothetical protein